MRLVLWLNMYSSWMMFHVHLKKSVFFCFRVECSLYIYIKLIWSNVLFKDKFSLLLFCNDDDLLINVSEALRSPTILQGIVNISLHVC